MGKTSDKQLQEVLEQNHIWKCQRCGLWTQDQRHDWEERSDIDCVRVPRDMRPQIQIDYEDALQTIRDCCRNGELLLETKILEIYHEASKVLDLRKTTLRDMRTGRKS